MGGVTKSHCKGSGHREGKHLYICIIIFATCLPHSVSSTLRGFLKRCVQGQLMVLTVNTLKTLFYHIRKKMTQLPMRKTIAQATLLVILLLFPDNRKINLMTYSFPNFEKFVCIEKVHQDSNSKSKWFCVTGNCMWSLRMIHEVQNNGLWIWRMT